LNITGRSSGRRKIAAPVTAARKSTRANLDPADRTLGTGGCELVPVSTLGEALDALIL
jgi:hypothetical protein